jgi:hypothetical protein
VRSEKEERLTATPSSWCSIDATRPQARLDSLDTYSIVIAIRTKSIVSSKIWTYVNFGESFGTGVLIQMDVSRDAPQGVELSREVSPLPTASRNRCVSVDVVHIDSIQTWSSALQHLPRVGKSYPATNLSSTPTTRSRKVT